MADQITNEVLATKIDYLTDLVSKHIDRDDERFDKLFGTLDGNGQPGLKTRLDRLEQAEASRKEYKGTITASVVGSIGAFLVSIVTWWTTGGR
jgi:hypothetical protein